MRTKQLSILAIIITLMMIACTKERYMDQPGNLVPATVSEDPSIPAITINGTRLHAEAFGHPDSTMVVFLHGGPGGDYRSLLNGRQLAAHGYRVVFYDQRGSGLSERLPKKSYTSQGLAALDQMYDDLKAVIAHYRTRPAQKVFLVGHSWGAILATGFAAKYPDRVQGLVVAEPGGLKWQEIKDYVKKSRDFSLWGETASDASYLDQFMSGKEDQHTLLDYKLAMLSARNDITGENNTRAASFWRPGAVVNTAFFEIGEDYQPDFSAGLQQFTVPVLFLYSSGNKAYPESWAQKISAAYTFREEHKINGTGHSGMIADNSAWTSQTLPIILNYFGSR